MIEVKTVLSQELAGNLLGNESERPLSIYLPPGYSQSAATRYPTVYLLHGFSNRAAFWNYGPALSFGAFHPPIDEIVTSAIVHEGLVPMIVVMPDGWSRLGCCQWVDSPVTGRFASHVVHEIVPWVDAHYRTIPQPAARGIAGISSGGFGAWHIASQYASVFGAVALVSAGSYFDLTLKQFFYRFYDRIYPSQPDGPVEGDIFSWMCYGMAAAYSPNPSAPPYYVDLPIDFPSGRVISEIWDRWLAFDPIHTCASRADDLRQLRGILLDAGIHDELGLHYGHRVLSKTMTTVGITHRLQEHDGDHTNRITQRVRVALGWFAETLTL